MNLKTTDFKRNLSLQRTNISLHFRDVANGGGGGGGYNKRVNFGETFFKKGERIRYGTQIMNMMSQYWNTIISVIKRVFDTRWGFAPHATLLPLNRHSLFHDEFDPGPFLTI